MYSDFDAKQTFFDDQKDEITTKKAIWRNSIKIIVLSTKCQLRNPIFVRKLRFKKVFYPFTFENSIIDLRNSKGNYLFWPKYMFLKIKKSVKMNPNDVKENKM